MKTKNDAEVRLKVTTDGKNTKKELNSLNSEAQKTPDLFNKISSVGKTAFKATTIAIGLATTALAGLITKSVSSYAELEQNIGGVETLFKKSSDTVIKNANKAYKTAGMSANEYMSTVTSFSARLLQGLNGDTKKAAKIADMAIIDMADNANKMGTSMESIQNAYQGFAKQNYTMLDNLKLGYGGTASEMARLINDSGVLGKTMKVTAQTVNNVSYDKQIEAIHKIQQEMGITGTTAKEAEETISGSINMLKASFDNFLNGSGDIDSVVDSLLIVGENISKVIVDLAPKIIDGIVKLVNKIVPKLPGLIQKLLPVLVSGAVSLVQGFVKVLPSIITTLTSMLPSILPLLMNGILQLINSIIQMAPTILQQLFQMIPIIATGIAEALPSLIPTIIEGIIYLMQVFNDNMPLFLEAGAKIILGIIQGLLNSIPLILQNLPTILKFIVNFFSISKLLGAGKTLIKGLANGLIKGIPELLSQIPKLVGKIINGFKNGGSLKDVGINLIKGLWQGIASVKDWILDKIGGFTKSVLKSVKSFFGIHSPSKEFAWIGKMNMLGFEEGMENMENDVHGTIEDTIGLDFLKGGVSNISNQYSDIAPNSVVNAPINVIVNANMDVNKFGQAFVRDVKTFSGGAKNSYNYGGM